ncbi:hypothetical protein HY995_00395 [Candidatus Micrarchaeota archaeon]|nr:hypothetical protein [Candidatus Micrarchaeota archaeon]MBI5176526.1 hypothetical protein [Candidatus Micrarchaeota archaeon]
MMGHGKGHDCMLCNMMFGKEEGKELKCSACGMSFASKSDRDAHATKAHKM